MKKLITAIGNSLLNERFKMKEDYEVVVNDINNDEELIECLEREKNIDILLLSSDIIKNYETEKLIEMIKKMQKDIMIILFKTEKTKDNLKEDTLLKIYTEPEIDWDFLCKMMQKTITNNIYKINSKVIAVSGASGVGKSTFSTFLAQNVENTGVKTLLIDFDLHENQIKTILKIKKAQNYTDNIKDNIININKNLDVLCNLDCIFTDERLIDYLKIQNMIDELKKNYNLIIIDTSSDLNIEYTKRIFYYSDEILFLLEPNILGMKKSHNMIEVFENDWKISTSKIKIILNKTNMYEISENIIKEILPEIEIIGKMKYLDSYNLMINKNVNKKEIKKEYEKIYKKILT